MNAGGIHRYLEAFPGGDGFFAGANFVFDERVTVPGGSAEIVGRCCSCNRPQGSYEPRVRCSRCRMLLLLCPACAARVRTHAAVCCSLNTRGFPAASGTMHVVDAQLLTVHDVYNVLS